MWKNYEAVQLLKVIPSTLNGREESDPKGHPEAKPKDLPLNRNLRIPCRPFACGSGLASLGSE